MEKLSLTEVFILEFWLLSAFSLIFPSFSPEMFLTVVVQDGCVYDDKYDSRSNKQAMIIPSLAW